MTKEIDETDDLLTERFRVFERLEPADVWADAAARAANGEPPTTQSRSRSSWRLAAAAAALAAVVVGAGLALRSTDDDRVASPPPTVTENGSPPDVVVPPASDVPAITDSTSTTVPGLRSARAIVLPNLVTPGGNVEITPIKPIEPMCGVVAILWPLEAGESPVGSIGPSGELDTNPTTTVLVCRPPVSADPIEVTIPHDTPSGQYVACLSRDPDPAGCARISVVDYLTTTTLPAATVAEYRVVAGVIQEPNQPPMAVFETLDSYPPQVGTGVELVGLDWSDVDDAQTADGTTWADAPFELVGTWDGVRLTLTRSPVPAEWPPAPPIEAETDDCDPQPLTAIAEGLDLDALGIIEVRIDASGGRCGLAIRALLLTPDLRIALEPLAETATVAFVLEPIG